MTWKMMGALQNVKLNLGGNALKTYLQYVIRYVEMELKLDKKNAILEFKILKNNAHFSAKTTHNIYQTRK